MSGNHRVDFEFLKARADFGVVLTHYGLTPVGRGTQTKIPCPFHADARPSCSVNLDKGLWHCFAGGCGAKGNVLDFVHRMETRSGETVSLRAAGIRLAEICGIPASEKAPEGARKPVERHPGSETRKRHSPSSPPAHGAPAASQARNKPLGFTLSLDPTHPYLSERGLTSELIAHFGLGLCTRGMLRDRICAPIHNERGELVAYDGRWIRDMAELPDGEGKYKQPPQFHKSLVLYNLNRVADRRHLVIVEGYWCVFALHQLGVPAVALMGSVLFDEQIELLKAAKVRLITLMLDGDVAGRTATSLILPRLAAAGFFVRDAVLPEGAQPDTVGEALLRQLLGLSASS